MNCNNNIIINSICSQIYRVGFFVEWHEKYMSLWLKFSHHIATARLPFRLFQRITNCYHLLKTILHCFSFKVSEFKNEMYYYTRIHKKIVSQWIIIKSVISVVASVFFYLTKVKLVIQSNLVAVVFKNINLNRNMLHCRPWLKQIPSRQTVTQTNPVTVMHIHCLGFFNALSFLLVIKLKG